MSFNMIGNPNKLVTEVYATKVLARKRQPKAEKSNEPGFLMLIGLAVGLALSFTQILYGVYRGILRLPLKLYNRKE